MIVPHAREGKPRLLLTLATGGLGLAFALAGGLGLDRL
jgi:adenine/guanine phosphoribosyltransferase-like PRPP-binding protein